MKKIVIDKSFLPHNNEEIFFPEDWCLWIPDTLLREIASTSKIAPNNLLNHFKGKNFRVLNHIFPLIRQELNSARCNKPDSKIYSNGLRKLLETGNTLERNNGTRSIGEFKNALEICGEYFYKVLKDVGQSKDDYQRLDQFRSLLTDPKVVILLAKNFAFSDHKNNKLWDRIDEHFMIYQYTRALTLMMFYRHSRGTLPSSQKKLNNESRDIEYLPYIYYADGFASGDIDLLKYARILYPRKELFSYGTPNMQ